MSNMKKFFAENGSLSDEGKLLVSPFAEALKHLLEEAGDLTVSEFRILGANLTKMVGDSIFEASKNVKPRDTFLWGMSDAEFDGYLKNKYGSKWMLATLTSDEFRRCAASKSNW
jgi:hypothetical protein